MQKNEEFVSQLTNDGKDNLSKFLEENVYSKMDEETKKNFETWYDDFIYSGIHQQISKYVLKNVKFQNVKSQLITKFQFSKICLNIHLFYRGFGCG